VAEAQDGRLSRGSILAIDGQGLKRLVEASLAWLRHHQAAINALNVFPVPDGDTGTNMLLTMQSAWAEIADSPEQNAGQIAQAIAHGALMGARGNWALSCPSCARLCPQSGQQTDLRGRGFG
jgi:hypothetical protein